MLMMSMIQDDWQESDVSPDVDLSEWESSERLIIFLGIWCHISAAMKQWAVEHHMFVYNAYVQRQGNFTFCTRYPSHGPKITWVEIFSYGCTWNHKYIFSGILLTGWIKRLLLCLRYLWVWWSNLRMWRLRWCLMPEQHGALWPSDGSLELMSSYGYQAALL